MSGTAGLFGASPLMTRLGSLMRGLFLFDEPRPQHPRLHVSGSARTISLDSIHKPKPKKELAKEVSQSRGACAIEALIDRGIRVQRSKMHCPRRRKGL